jgi:hypothetical protein
MRREYEYDQSTLFTCMNVMLMKNKQKKGLGAWPQVVEHLPSKCVALNSNPSTVKKKKKERN